MVCNYCEKVMKGRITRVKEHLMAKKDNVVACTQTPRNAREDLWKLFKEKTANPSLNPVCSVAAYDNYESEDEVCTASNDKRRTSGGKKGPMNMVYINPTTTIKNRKIEKLRQANIKEAHDKNLKV